MQELHKTLIASVVSATISRIATHPLDTLRTLAQLDTSVETDIDEEPSESLEDTTPPSKYVLDFNTL